ncbi:MAG: class I adenylate-forming enzyme family protein [Hyphomicrobiaceae bacterium]
MNLSYTLQRMAECQPQRPAVTEEGRTLSYAALEDQTARIAGALRSHHGLTSGDRVGIWMENCLEYLPIMFGAWRAGLAVVPINAKLHAKELQWILDNSGAKLCLVTPDKAAHLAELPSGARLPTIIETGSRDHAALLAGEAIRDAPVTIEDEAWLFYTSGTTGRPKGAILTHRNLLFAAHAYTADIDYIDHRDTCFHAAPLSHGSGCWAVAFTARGGHNVIVPGSFEPERILKAVPKYPNVAMFAAPTMVTRLMTHPLAGSADTRNLKTISYGGAPMYVADIKRAMAVFGPKFYQLFGQGEAPMTISGLPKWMHAESGHPRYDERLGSTGIARTGCAIKVVDEAGRELPRGEIGEIVTRSDCVMKGYWANPEANAKALRDGWLWTGDLGTMDAEGFLTIKDRSKDMIISGGSNIYPREIEEVLLTHPAVLEAAVVSRPHADWGEEVIAYVVLRPGAQAEAADLDRLCLDNIARYKRPRGYRFVAALPKNNYGKILKTELRAQLIEESRD